MAEKSCPYLKKVECDWLYPVEGYCEGYGGGKLRIPSIAEYREFCTSGRHTQCQTYVFRKKDEEVDHASRQKDETEPGHHR
ncbi:MAG: hypothetical protein HY998_03290 [candidate division NC10 bacterium]|nr:hypothetical protein [candidate division NC10 bacterium]